LKHRFQVTLVGKPARLRDLADSDVRCGEESTSGFEPPLAHVLVRRLVERGLANTFKFEEERQPGPGSGNVGLLVREPVGVVAAIIPWNGPAMASRTS
jgi:hypothetical protein